MAVFGFYLFPEVESRAWEPKLSPQQPGRKGMNDISAAITRWLNQMFDGRLPYDQPSSTAFAGALTYSLIPSNARSPVLYCGPKKSSTKQLLADHNIPFTPGEWLMDFTVLERESATKRTPLIACESEMHRNHGVGYSFDVWQDAKGRVWQVDG